jgi:hypothetical protein
MPADYVLFDWAERSARAGGHLLGDWEQDGDTATATCLRCGRNAIVDFSREAAERDEEIRGDAVAEDCTAGRS